MANIERIHPHLKPGDLVQAIKDQVLLHSTIDFLKSHRMSQGYKRLLQELGSPPKPHSPSPPGLHDAASRRMRMWRILESQPVEDDLIPEVGEGLTTVHQMTAHKRTRRRPNVRKKGMSLMP